jgi:hypothetical protein
MLAGSLPATRLGIDRAHRRVPLGRKRFIASCDIAKAALAKAGVPYSTEQHALGIQAAS